MLKILIGAVCFVITLPFAQASDIPVETYKSNLRYELTELGIKPNLIERVIAQIKVPSKEVSKRLKNQPEFKMTFAEYQGRLVSDYRVKKGIENYLENRDDLMNAEARFGIPAHVITALWGIETSYGAIKPDFDMVPSLATLAMTSHRKDFFHSELLKAVEIVNEGHIPLEKFKGSWAGAMGQCQFMPSSFMSFAADGNNDGKKDIWSTKPDVFASAANYLKQSGWKEGMKWKDRVILGKILPKGLNFSDHGMGDKKTVAEWKKLGVYDAKGGFVGVKDSDVARLYIPEGPSGKAYLVYHNFDVILKWNRSSFFAYAVLSLADEIEKGAES